MISVKCMTATLLTFLLWSASASGADIRAITRLTGSPESAASGADIRAITRPTGSPEIAASKNGTAPQALRLSLHDALELTLAHNLELQVWREDTHLAEGAVMAARGPFDPILTASAPGIVGQDPMAFSSAAADPSASAASSSDGTAGTTGSSLLAGPFATRSLTLSTALPAGTSLAASYALAPTGYLGGDVSYGAIAGLEVTQPLLRDLGIPAARRDLLVAKNGLEATKESVRSRLQDLLLRTIQAYWDLVFRQDDLEVKQAAVDLAREQLARNEAEVRIGALAPSEIIQAQQAVAAAEYQQIQAELALGVARDQLRQLIDVEAVGGWGLDLVATDKPGDSAAPVSLLEALSTAKERDPALRQARIAASSQRIDLRYYRNQRLPRVDLVATVGVGAGLAALVTSGAGDVVPAGETSAKAGTASGSAASAADKGVAATDSARRFGLDLGRYYTWGIGLSVGLPVLGWESRGHLAQARAREQQARKTVALREQQVELAVRVAVRQVGAQSQGVAAARRARELAEKQLEAEQRKFEIGASTTFQVLQLQRQLSDARTQELHAQVTLEVARAGLDWARGTLGDGLSAGSVLR